MIYQTPSRQALPLVSRHKVMIVVGVLGVSALAWLISLQQSNNHSESMVNHPLVGALNFVGMWTVMMAAMMLPSFLPAVLLFSTIAQSRKEFGYQPASSSALVVGYLGIWAVMGIGLAFVYIYGNPMVMAWSQPIIAGALIVAGVYQLTRWKTLCLGHCRSPMHFFMNHWRDGGTGAVRMGIDGGLYCVGCCWGLMLAQIAVGLMNPAYMGIIALFIFVEKIIPRGELLARIIGAGFLLVGIAVSLQWILAI